MGRLGKQEEVSSGHGVRWGAEWSAPHPDYAPDLVISDFREQKVGEENKDKCNKRGGRNAQLCHLRVIL